MVQSRDGETLETYHNPNLHVHRLVLVMLQASVNMEKTLDDNKHDYALSGGRYFSTLSYTEPHATTYFV